MVDWWAVQQAIRQAHEPQPEPAHCEKCGQTLVWGENAATMLGRVCFDCRPMPDYSRNGQAMRVNWGNEDALDALEDRCLGDGAF